MARRPNTISHYFKHENAPETEKPIRILLAQAVGQLDANLPDSAEKSAGLRKLLEAQDCFLRCLNPPLFEEG